MPHRLYYSDHYQIPLPPGHKFPVRKYALLRQLLAVETRFEMAPAPLASFETITLIHDSDYVRGFLGGSLEPRVLRRIGFPWSEALVQRTLASVGGTVAAAHDALGSTLGGALAGGTHHAFRNEGSGFCVFNDIAVAIAALRAEDRISRGAIIDLDVHQGDGTAKIFEDDPEVLTISVHGRHNFPFRKQVSKLDIDLPDATGDIEYLAVLGKVMERALAFKPEIVFFQSGVDALGEDKLGRLSMTRAGLMDRDRVVLGALHAASFPTVITLGGGYAEPIELTVEAHANTFRIAEEVWDQPLASNRR
jgi:acetoin utilization deacetylase AcuC-like enzyme